MPTVEFVGQSSQDIDNISANTSRLINFYREPVDAGGSTRYVLKTVLGQVPFVDVDTVYMRALEWVDNKVYSITGGKLHEISSLGGVVKLADVPDDENTCISGNYGILNITADSNLYAWNGSLITPTELTFYNVGSVDYVGGYTLITEKGGRRFQWSNLANSVEFDPLDFASAEGEDDAIIRGVAINGNYVIFKERTTEVWYPTGQASSEAFTRTAGPIWRTGLKDFNLVAKADNLLFFIGDDNIVYISSGGEPSPISPNAVVSSIALQDPQRCFYYEDEGHKICVIRFAGRPAWCYDISTGEWHERAEGENFGPWTAVNAVKAYGQWLCGTDGGSIYKMARNNRDLGGALHRRAVSRTFDNGSLRFKVKMLEFGARVGMSELGRAFTYVLGTANGWAVAFGNTLINLGDVGDSRRPAVFWIRISRDGGRTWSNERARSFGDLGEYQTRAVFRSLGQYRRITVELNLSDATEIPIYADAIWL